MTLSALCAILGKTYELVSPTHPVHLHRTETHDDHVLLEGSFVSPLALLCPDMIPQESVWARFQLVLPKGFPVESLSSAPESLSEELVALMAPEVRGGTQAKASWRDTAGMRREEKF